jgi:hypothetical protein
MLIAQGGTGARTDSRRRDRRFAAGLQGVMGNTTGVPQLHGDTAMFSVNAGGDFLPCRDLFRAVQTWGAGIAFCLG